MNVTVVGAGVIGLLSALALAESGHEVRMVARGVGTSTTSARAGASFKPSGVVHASPYSTLLRRSAEELRSWDADGRSARRGVTRATHIEASSAPIPPPDYLDVMDDVTWLSRDRADVIPGQYAHAVSYTTWFFDVPVVLSALTSEITERGIPIDRRQLESLGEIAGTPDVIVHATGLGARELADDEDVVPVRGQTVLVDTPTTSVPSISADGFYAYPRRDGVLLGGTSLQDAWDETPDDEVTDLLIRGNARVLPTLLNARPARVDVGLRPLRTSGIRLALDGDGPTPVVHAYGHGGSGWTLGPGTARVVVDLVDGVAASLAD